MKKNKARGSGNLGKLLKALKPYSLMIGFAFAFTAVSVVISVLAPQFLQDFTNEIANNEMTRTINMDTILRLAIILMSFYVVNALCHFGSNFVMTTVGQKYSKGIRSAISKKINRVPLSYFDSRQLGDTMSIITNDVDTIGQSMDQGLATMFYSITMLVAVIIAMFATSWQMALTVMSMIPLMLLMSVVLFKFAMPQFTKNQQYLGILNGCAEENYTGQTVIQAFNASGKMTADFESKNRRLRFGIFKGQSIAGFMQPAMMFIAYFAYAAVFVVGGILMNDGNKITIGTIMAFLLYINLFQSPMQQLAQAINSMQLAGAAASRVYDFVESEELSDESGKDYKLLGRGDIRGDVEFKNVKFGYTPDKIIIPDFSAKVKAGMKVAIVGPTGAGKTTLVNLLMRFYELDGGDITIDGVSIKDMPREEVHDIFGMVLQDTWMFEGTIRENILFSKGGVSDERIEEILKEAGISHYVHTLPGGLDYVIENESGISGGQKQLMTIARAMAENSPLLILDEATSNVDTRTEELIQTAMDKLTEGRTSFVIAHRLSTIKNADLILVMRDGNIVEQGNHESLIALNGFYANLYNSQFANE